MEADVLAECSKGIVPADWLELVWWLALFVTLVGYAAVRRWRPVPRSEPFIEITREAKGNADD